MQSAADAGATAGALELTYGGDKVAIETQALDEAKRNGFKKTASTSFVVNHPPLSGAYAGDPTAVEVVLDVQREATFASALSFDKDVAKLSCCAG